MPPLGKAIRYARFRVYRQIRDVQHDRAHRAFHQALVGSSGVWRLSELQTPLFDQAYRYRRVLRSKGLDPLRNLELHQTLTDLALGSNIEAACKALVEHSHLTWEAFEHEGPD